MMENFLVLVNVLRDFPGGSVVKNLPARLGDAGKRHGFDPWVGKIPWRKEMATHSSILAWRIPTHGIAKGSKMTG